MLPVPHYPQTPAPYYRNPRDGTTAAVGAGAGVLVAGLIVGVTVAVGGALWARKATPEEITEKSKKLAEAKWPAVVGVVSGASGAAVGAAMGAPQGKKGRTAAAAGVTYAATAGLGHAVGWRTAGALVALGGSMTSAYAAAR